MPADSVSIRIYSGIARFPCDSMAFLFMIGLHPSDRQTNGQTDGRTGDSIYAAFYAL